MCCGVGVVSLLLLVNLNDSGLETLGGRNVDGLDVREELLLGVLLVVSLSRDSESHSVGNTLDSSLPQLLVESGVESDVLSTHVELGELLDLLDGSRSSLLELDTEHLG